MLGVSLRTVDRLIAVRQLPVRRLGRRVLIRATACKLSSGLIIRQKLFDNLAARL